MRVRPVDIERVARSMVAAALKQGFVHPLADIRKLELRVAELITENFQQEQKIEADAEKLAAGHAREMAGMDQRRIVQGIKERLARERGFSL
jgi:hypothetical protein